MPRWVWLIAYLAVAVADLVAEWLHATVLAFVAVLLAMPALLGYLWTARLRSDRLTRLVSAALFFSWLGDWVGDLISPHVVSKLLLFFFGHICFVLAFWPYRRRSVLYRPLPLALYVLIIGGSLTWIAMHAGILAPAVVCYGALLGLMAIAATGLNAMAGIGAIIFVGSDLSIAVTVFVVSHQWSQAELLIMSTYLVAQLLIVRGVLRRQAIDWGDPNQPSRPGCDAARATNLNSAIGRA